MIFAQENGRTIPKEDKIFGISFRAKQMIAERGKENVVNATIGALLDDHGNLIVLSSIYEAFKSLTPSEFAEYAPIQGIDSYKKALLQDAFREYKPKSFCEAIATPGGTGAIKNAVSNYTKQGDKILIADWYWAPYKTIAQEQGRDIETFTLFDNERKFNVVDFKEKLDGLMKNQDETVVILNTPAHNPTGYTMSDEDWNGVKKVFSEVPMDKKIALFVDTAYIDFAGESMKYRTFLPIIDSMPQNVLPIIGHSLSKAYTMYGLRAGAMICMAHTKEEAEEFRMVCAYSSRAAWSNCPRAPQVILSRVYEDPILRKRVEKEREYYRIILQRRGKALEEASREIGLEMVPFDTGFFASFPHPNPDAVSNELEKEGIFLVPLAKGLRVSVASISEEVARELPAKIKAAMERI